MSSKIKAMVLTAVISSLILVFTFIPYTGYISYGLFSITTIHVPVLIGAIVLGKRAGFILGLVWGLTSLLRAYVIPSPESILFTIPMVSVLPRVIVGFTIGTLSDILKNNVSKFEVSTFLAVLGTLLNTILVLSAVFIWGNENILSLGESIMKIFGVVVSINGILELAVAAIVTPFVTTSLRIAGYTNISHIHKEKK